MLQPTLLVCVCVCVCVCAPSLIHHAVRYAPLESTVMQEGEGILFHEALNAS
jgi:hypothetical protein